MARTSRRRSSFRFVRELVAAAALVMAASAPALQAAESSKPAGHKPPSSSKAQGQHSSSKASKSKPKSKTKSQKRRSSRKDDLALKSNAVLVVDQDTGETLATKNADKVVPIASLTKLMTALVVINTAQPLDEVLEITREDLDREKHSYSRLPPGTKLTRDEMLLLALMSSENRAASALSRHYPGGRTAFVAKMNQEAQSLGLTATHFTEATGLSQRNVSTARDLHRLVTAAHAQPLIRDYSTQLQGIVKVKGRKLQFGNSNRLVSKSSDWDIELQKTGFTNEAGRCLVMQANVLGRRLAMIFLDSDGKLTRYGDAARVRRQLQISGQLAPQPASANLPIRAPS